MLAAIYLTTAVGLLGLLAHRPYLLLRPSVWVCLGMIVRINAAAAFCGPDVDGQYADAFWVRLLTVCFPLAIGLWLLATPSLSELSRRLYRTCREANRPYDRFGRAERGAVLVLGWIAGTVVLAYLAVIPLHTTGLAAVFCDPAHSFLAREKSLKLLTNWPVKYVYMLHLGVLAPCLVVLLTLWKPRRLAEWAVRAALLGMLFVSVMLSGARGPAGLLLIVIAVACLLRRGMLRGGLALSAALCGVLAIAAALSVFREGRGAELSADTMVEHVKDGILQRLVVLPYQTGVWTLLYAREHGPVGLRNIRPMAIIAGQEYLNLPNQVALAYASGARPSSAATTSFLFDFQASFGLAWGWIVSLAGLASLDYLLVAFSRLKPMMAVACLATFLGAMHFLVASQFTVTLVSHGVLAVVLLGFLLGQLPWCRRDAPNCDCGAGRCVVQPPCHVGTPSPAACQTC